MPDYKILPILTIRQPIGSPSHPPWSAYITTDARFEEARRKGGVRNLARYALDQSVTGLLRNQNTGDKEERRNRAVGLTYSLQAQDEYNDLSAWETVPTIQEAAQLASQLEKYRTLRDALEEEQRDAPLNPEKADLLQSYRNIIGEVSLLSAYAATGQMGFLEVIPDVVFGGGGTCLHDMNGTPNVRKLRRSTFMTDKDRAIHLGLYFAAPQLDQADTDFKIRWDRYILQFMQGRAVRLKAYTAKYWPRGRRPNLAAIQRLEDRLEHLYDYARLTPDDMTYIEGQQAIIRAHQKTIKDQKLQPDDAAYRALAIAIDEAEDLIRARRTLKQRAPGAILRQIALIEADLYLIDKPINLNEDVENFYNTPLHLTILAQRRGFISFVLNGGTPVTVELPDIIKTKSYGTVWNPSFIIFDSNGGSYDWKFIYPNFAVEGEYRLKDIDVGFMIDPAQAVYLNGDWDTSGPGTSVAVRVENSADWTPMRPLYDFVVTLRNDVPEVVTTPGNVTTTFWDGAYTPWIYSMQVFLNAGPRPENTTILWNSLDFGSLYTLTKTATASYPNLANDCPIADVRLTYDDISDSRRGASLQIDLLDPNGTLGLPSDGYKNHLCDFKCGLFDNQAEGVVGVQGYFLNCVIKEAVLCNVRDFDESDPASPQNLYNVDSYWRLQIGDMRSLLDDYKIQDEIILDGRTLGERLWLLLGLMGWTADDLAGIPITGTGAGPRASRAGAGERPAKAPAKGVGLGAYVQQMFDEDGVTDDDAELSLRTETGVFTLATPPTARTFGFSGGDSAPLPQIVKSGAQKASDWSRFYNWYEVHGRRDPITGEPLIRRLPILDSINTPASLLYIGSERRYDLQVRDDLDTAGLVERACEILAIRNSKSGDFKLFDSFWLYPPQHVGNRGLVDAPDDPTKAVTMEIVRLSMSLRDAGNCSVVLRPVVAPNF